MNIAVITGASSGLGTEFAKAVDKTRFDIDEIWLIARREERLKETAESLSKKSKVLSLDITDNKSVDLYINALKSENANVKLLINNAGFGKLGLFYELSSEDNAGMVRLNCEALTIMSNVTLPFMNDGAEIINICSIASFAPNARMAVYSSTKAYVMSFSRALREELNQRKINCLAVCPGPMETEFLKVANIAKGSSKAFDTLPRDKAERVAKNSLKASKREKAVYADRFLYKLYYVIAKILPTSLVMKLAKT